MINAISNFIIAHPFYDILMLLLTVIALGISIFHVLRLVRIAKDLSTRFIGYFPKHLVEITALIAGATKSIEVLSDCVDYGSFREPVLHDELIRNLLNISAGSVGVKVLIWGQPAIFSAANRLHDPDEQKKCDMADLLAQFTTRLSNDLRFVKRFASLFATANEPPETRLRSTTAVDLLAYLYNPSAERIETLGQLILCLHEYEVQRLRGRDADVVIHFAAEERAELFFWIVDRRRAVLLLPSQGKDALAFITQDSELVTRLGEIFDRKWKLAQGAGKQNSPAVANTSPLATEPG